MSRDADRYIDIELPQAAIESLKQGRKIGAIKIVREQEGLDLKDAKERVERWIKDKGHMYPEIRNGIVGAGGSSAIWIALLVLLAAAGFLAYTFLQQGTAP